MSSEDVFARISGALSELDEDTLLSTLKTALEEGVDPNELLNRGLVQGLDEVGRQFEARVVFLPELMIAAEIATQAFDLVLPYVKKDAAGGGQGKVVMGTVRGDVHDIGKTIVVSLLKATGFDVVDLGVDVPPEEFVRVAIEEKAQVIGLSSLISSASSGMVECIDIVRRECPSVKVIVGGAATTQEAADAWGADGWALDAWGGVEKIRELAMEVARS